MKNINKVIIVNILIIIFIILSLYNKYFLFPLSFFIVINILLFYKESNKLDNNERKKKLILHKIKNSLSVILGYSEAYNDELIKKEDFDKKINDEIKNIVEIIKDEIHK